MSVNCKDIGLTKWTYAAKYLGVMIGPEAANCAWDEALAKYESRALRWGAKGGAWQLPKDPLLQRFRGIRPPVSLSILQTFYGRPTSSTSQTQ